MLDEQSLTVTYQGWRGEPRGTRQAMPRAAQRSATASIAAPASTPARPASTSATASSSNASTAACASMPATTIMERTGRPEVADHLGHAGAAEGEGGGRHERVPSAAPAHHHLRLGAGAGGGGDGRGAGDAARRRILSVQHDRAPLFVRAARRRPAQRLHGEDRQQDAARRRVRRCPSTGWRAAALAVAEADPASGAELRRCRCRPTASARSACWSTGRPTRLEDGSQRDRLHAAQHRRPARRRSITRSSWARRAGALNHGRQTACPQPRTARRWRHLSAGSSMAAMWCRDRGQRRHGLCPRSHTFPGAAVTDGFDLQQPLRRGARDGGARRRRSAGRSTADAGGAAIPVLRLDGPRRRAAGAARDRRDGATRPLGPDERTRADVPRGRAGPLRRRRGAAAPGQWDLRADGARRRRGASTLHAAP